MRTHATLWLTALLIVSGCASSPQRPAADDAAPRPEPQKPLVVYVLSGSRVIWDGWIVNLKSPGEATTGVGGFPLDLQDPAELLRAYHPRSIVIRGAKGNTTNYSDAVKVREILLKAGATNVQIGSGAVTGE